MIVYGIPTECDAEELAAFFSKYDGSVCPAAQVRDLQKKTCISAKEPDKFAKEPDNFVKETCTRDPLSFSKYDGPVCPAAQVRDL